MSTGSGLAGFVSGLGSISPGLSFRGSSSASVSLFWALSLQHTHGHTLQANVSTKRNIQDICWINHFNAAHAIKPGNKMPNLKLFSFLFSQVGGGICMKMHSI